MDLDEAIRAHAEWKSRLRTAIASKERVDAATIASDEACQLGKWLHGEARTLYGRVPVFAGCVQRHAAFHREAGKVAQAINSALYGEAERMLGANTAYSDASKAVIASLYGLQREVRI